MTAPLNCDDLLQRLDQLNQIGAALSSERQIERLLENILLAAKGITHADGGTLYEVTADRQALRFSLLHNDSLGITCGGTAPDPIPAHLPLLPLYREGGGYNDSLVAVYAATHGQTVNIADVTCAQGFDFSGTQRFDATFGYRSRAFLTVPMRNHENETIGVLQLINRKDPLTGELSAFNDADQRLAESLASQAAVALSNRHLISQLETLFESLIRLINTAIEEKSPYTGAHCQRVPQLTLMLADALDQTTAGPFAGFRFSDDERYALKIAALLHDCGKITTPVHVVDKATKLQTIFDRIELLDTRFAALLREAETDCLRARLQGQPQAAAERALQARQAQIEADRQFLHQANQGSERMPEADKLRIQAIAGRYVWRDASGVQQPVLLPDEVENLSVMAGTLTEAERRIINQHIVSSINMLEALIWPRHLKMVPEYAGGHHERMDGKGYPRGLTREQMSIPARLMGIADIFEALTASDRPYKRAMKLSEALAIMDRFSRTGHIDPDLYEVFVREKVHLRYARAFMSPQQIDIQE